MNDPDLETAKILIVDDEIANTLLLERLLKCPAFLNANPPTSRRGAETVPRIPPGYCSAGSFGKPKNLDGFGVLEQFAVSSPPAKFCLFLCSRRRRRSRPAARALFGRQRFRREAI